MVQELQRNRVFRQVRRSKPAQLRQNEVKIANRIGVISRRTVPLYRTLIRSQAYAGRIIRAINATDVDELGRIIQEQVPGSTVSLGAGFSACLDFPNPASTFCTGMFRPGFRVTALQIRQVSRIALPLVVRIGTDASFRRSVARLFVRRRNRQLLQLIRRTIPASQAVGIIVDDLGFAVVLRLPSGARFNFVYDIEI